MGIPPGLMPGSPQGGPPMGGSPMGGQPMGGPDQGGDNPLGNPELALQILTSMQQAPPQSGEDALFKQATDAVKATQAVIGQLYNRVGLRSAKASRSVGECLPKLSDCLARLQSGQQALATEPARPMDAPPNLGLGMSMGPAPTSPMPGM